MVGGFGLFFSRVNIIKGQSDHDQAHALCALQERRELLDTNHARKQILITRMHCHTQRLMHVYDVSFPRASASANFADEWKMEQVA